MRFILACTLFAFVAGCTCNDPAGNGRPNAVKGAKMKAKMKMKAKSKQPTIPASIWLVDKAKLDAGDADPWVAVERQIGPATPAKNSVWQLFKGPTPEEAERGLVLFKSGAEGFENFDLQGDMATLQLRGGCSSEGGAITVYDHLSRTLKGFPEVKTVRVLGPDGTTQAAEGDSRPACLEP